MPDAVTFGLGFAFKVASIIDQKLKTKYADEIKGLEEKIYEEENGEKRDNVLHDYYSRMRIVENAVAAAIERTKA